jgi:hypothetical protein
VYGRLCTRLRLVGLLPLDSVTGVWPAYVISGAAVLPRSASDDMCTRLRLRVVCHARTHSCSMRCITQGTHSRHSHAKYPPPCYSQPPSPSASAPYYAEDSMCPAVIVPIRHTRSLLAGPALRSPLPSSVPHLSSLFPLVILLGNFARF